MTTLYGIKNCDTVRKARKWLEAQGIDYTFHDVRADGLTKKAVTEWAKAVGWETLLNRRGTTWRQLSDSEKESATNQKAAIDLMLEHPALIKRPVLVHKKGIHVGFKPAEYEALF